MLFQNPVIYLLIFIGAVLISSLSILFPAQPLIHVFQLESYKRPQFFMRLKDDRSSGKARMKYWLAALAIQIILVIVVFVVFLPLELKFDAMSIASVLLISIVFLLMMAAYYFLWKRQPSKKPLKNTARVIRLDTAIVVLAVVLHAVVELALAALSLLLVVLMPDFSSNAEEDSSLLYISATSVMLFSPYLCLIVSQFIMVSLLPRLLALASFVVQPVEKAVQNWYLNDAKKKLSARKDLIVVGITGSYGKTSAKVILATILSEKYRTYATPASYNTPMGLTRAIREQLEPGHQVFIAEMGARHRGDIAELCRLVHPKYGLITSIGPQHLETMFTIENIAKTKYELIEALPTDGMGFLPSDNEICMELYKKTGKPKALFGFDGHGEQLYMAAGDIEHGPQGSSFTLTGPGGGTVRCATRLLGKHNVQNILGCAAVARALGLTMEEIARGIAKAEPVEHRLQLIPTTNGVTVIDDAFNSNPAGTRAAMEVLKDFPGRKIVVTPGLVELGDAEEAENEAFGRAMAPVVDIAILVARNAPAIRRGLLAAGFPEENLIVTGRLSEATAALGHLTRVGDVVLFENDLPDHYEV